VDLRNELITLFENIKADKVDLLKAKELNNSAGKIIGTAKIQLQYNEQMGEKKKIEFLEP
jgi:hypothetical protein